MSSVVRRTLYFWLTHGCFTVRNIVAVLPLHTKRPLHKKYSQKTHFHHKKYAPQQKFWGAYISYFNFLQIVRNLSLFFLSQNCSKRLFCGFHWKYKAICTPTKSLRCIYCYFAFCKNVWNNYSTTFTLPIATFCLVSASNIIIPLPKIS